MVGKAQLIVVVGFSLVFSVLGFFWGDITSSSVDNYTDYYKKTVAHNIAVSGANIALTKIYLDPTWKEGISGLSYQDGSIDVNINQIDSTTIEIISVGSFVGKSKTVKIKLNSGGYNKFAWYIGNASSKTFITGDEIWGPFHSQSHLNIGGDPVFNGYVTVHRSIKPGEKQMASYGYDPKFLYNPRTGIDLPLPKESQFDVQKNKAIASSSFIENTDVALFFNSDGNVVLKTGTGADISSYVEKGTFKLSEETELVFYLDKGDVYLSGTVNGKAVVVADQSSGLGGGNIYLLDDIKYRQKPMLWDETSKQYVKNTACKDMLGMLATNNVRIATSVESGGYANNVMQKDIEVHANIYCEHGGVQVEGLNGLSTPMGKFILFGGMVADKEEYLARMDNNDNLVAGYTKYVVFDKRFGIDLPPKFPKLDAYEIISWLE